MPLKEKSKSVDWTPGDNPEVLSQISCLTATDIPIDLANNSAISKPDLMTSPDAAYPYRMRSCKWA